MDDTSRKELAPIEQGTAMAAILKIAENPNMDIEKLRALVGMQQDYMDRAAKKEFAADFAAMKPLLPLVVRVHENKQTSSKYAKMEDINKIVDPILAQYGFATSMKVIAQTEQTVTGRVELIHKGGHIETTEITMPIDDRGIAGTVNKTKPHAISSTIMYIRRVGECALLNISTGDDKDGNAVTENKLISIEQAADIDMRIRKLGEDYVARFLKWLGVSAVNELPEKDYKKAMAGLQKAEKEKTNA